MIQDITIRLSVDVEHKNWWTIEFNDNGKEYFIMPSIVYPIKKRDRIRYLLNNIQSEYICKAEYNSNCSWTKEHKSLVIHRDFKNTSLNQFITDRGVNESPLKGGSVENMKLDKSLYESKYLKAEDLEDTVVKATIKECILVDTIKDDNPDSSPACFFKEYEKGLVLNKTNMRELVNEWGDDTKEWENKVVHLMTVKANNPQTKQMVDSIRIGIPKKKD